MNTPFRIYVQASIPDARAEAKRKQFLNQGVSVSKVKWVDCYTVDAALSPKQRQKALGLLANPVVERASLRLESQKQFDWVIEIGFLPGVTDNIGGTARETLADGVPYKFKQSENVYSSLVLFLKGKISLNAATKIANSLYNPLIQRAVILNWHEFKTKSLPATVPKVSLTASANVLKVNLQTDEQELINLGKLGIMDTTGIRKGPLALDLDALKAIQDHFKTLGRMPTDVELESLAQTWSEHCKHTIFASPIDEIKDGLYKHYIKRATKIIRQKKGKNDFCVSVFHDNAGAIAFDENFLVTHKVETHNTPSALDPFGGAITGLGGVNRDALGFGLGAKPIANVYGFCLGDPKDKTNLFRDQDLNNKMLSSERIMQGVVAGINSGGNQSGIPTPLGFVYFEPRFRGKPLVFAGTVGLIPKKIGKKLSHTKKARAGDYIVTIGGRVGKDGIHGATFSSEGLDPSSPAGAVQIGDPITQKKFSDAIVREAREANLYNSITDNGAGGLSSSVGEMAEQSGGCLVWLDKVPVKYSGLQPWEIWISESQERMTLAVPPKTWKKFAALMAKRDVEATVIGQFTKTGKCVVKYGKQTVMDVSLNFLHHGNPIKKLVTKKPVTAVGADIIRPKNRKIIFSPTQLKSQILTLLSRLNICSYEFISQQYDHEVQAGSVTKPLQGRGRVNAEAAVLRPVLNSQKGIVLSYGLNPSYSELDPYNMAACAIDSAARAAVAAGANIDKLALLDNFCWCSSDEPERLWRLKQAAKAAFDTAVAFGTPFISGKDSMFNDFKGFSARGGSASGGNRVGKPVKISIPPTLLISALGVIPDIDKALTLDAKQEGDLVYILGETCEEFGGSEYGNMIFGGAINNGFFNIPKVNAKKNLALYRDIYKAAQNNLIASAISVGRGGLAAALGKMCVAGALGAEINLYKISGGAKNIETKLFSESQGRILVTVDPSKQKNFEKIMRGSFFANIGKIGGKEIILQNGKEILATIPVAKAERKYKETLKMY